MYLELCQKAQAILKTHRVEGLLDYDYDYEVPTPSRPGRYQITTVTSNQTRIQQVEQQLGYAIALFDDLKKKLD